ncbi:DeoR/GlpR transcriptional regulator [Egibacter rhizosphaerae]|uniref:DeoR/GlpR transcriptional regulator n=1 Tax=Egibacter rhizosphaerae TaxID=1670831 RepID=A0A411YE98_9ACTN|nr:DeoR/GlpR family DNA-binding transcription regulator [Egibacter rhizosphaerae]QBI19545.1 DeoR/GlpR transcriptional regulator [Egibacter rhizosphaerae]
MDRRARWNKLLELLSDEGSLDVATASERLGVSPATVRRDFKELAEQDLATRTHGGIVATAVAYDLPLRYRSARRAAEKQRIGRIAANLVAPGEVVGLNGGTTTTEVARALGGRSDLREAANVTTVVTNALNIASELVLRTGFKLVVVGGRVRSQTYELVGPFAGAMLDDVVLDVVFIGVDAIDSVLGATSNDEDEATTSRQMASRARRTVVVADSHKLGKQAFVRTLALSGVQTLVTDPGATSEELDAFAEAGITVLTS